MRKKRLCVTRKIGVLKHTEVGVPVAQRPGTNRSSWPGKMSQPFPVADTGCSCWLQQEQPHSYTVRFFRYTEYRSSIIWFRGTRVW